MKLDIVEMRELSLLRRSRDYDPTRALERVPRRLNAAGAVLVVTPQI
jgi:hypothetical protein